jgi:hypothetical protein
VKELDLLVDALGREPDDDWIFVGDLVGKGEASREVIDRVIDLRARAAVGNHELKWLDFHHHGDASALKTADHIAALRLENKHWDFLKCMHPWIDLPQENAIVVHGGFSPSMPWRDQDLQTVTSIQVLDSSGHPRMRKNCPDGKPWAEYWMGPEWVFYGHTPKREVAIHQHATGLDTGCVHGGMLTAMILPERRLVQIPARRVYCQADF